MQREGQTAHLLVIGIVRTLLADGVSLAPIPPHDEDRNLTAVSGDGSTGKLFITMPKPFQRQNLLCLQEGRKAKFQSNINITKHRTEHGNKKFQIKGIKVF